MNDVGKTVSPASHSDIDASFRSHLPPLFLLASIFLLNFSSRIISAPLLPTLEKDLSLSHGDAGSLFLFLSIGYFISLLGSGHISSRISHKKTIVISAISVGISLSSISFVHSFFALQCCVFLLGISAGTYLPSGITTLTSLVHPKHWGKAVAIHELAPNLSFILTPLLVEMLLQVFLWRYILRFIGIISIILGVVFFRYGKGGLFLGKPPNFKAIKPILKAPDFWMLMVLFGLAITSTLGIYNMLPLYLTTEHGASLDWANSLVGISRIPALGMSFLAGMANHYGLRIFLHRYPDPASGYGFHTLGCLCGIFSTDFGGVLLSRGFFGIICHQRSGKQKCDRFLDHSGRFCSGRRRCSNVDWNHGGLRSFFAGHQSHRSYDIRGFYHLSFS